MTKQEMMKMIAEGNSVSQMSEITGKSKGSIRYWLGKFELKTKNKLYNKKEIYKCRSCGETEEDKMKNCGSGRRAFSICQACYNKDTVLRGRQKKIDLVNMMGGKCLDCGYNKNYSAMEFHHLDPSIKDPDFKSRATFEASSINLNPLIEA